MAITSVLFYLVRAPRAWRWPRGARPALTALFLSLDLAFLGANLAKVRAGGWVPLAIAAAVYILLSTWKRGTELMRALLARASVPFEPFLERLARVPPPRVAGTARLPERDDGRRAAGASCTTSRTTRPSTRTSSSSRS